MEKELKLKCVTLKGELADWRKHILMPIGVTLCGIPTIDCDSTQFPQIKEGAVKDLVSEYTNEEWDITCEKCLEMINIVQKHKESCKHIN